MLFKSPVYSQASGSIAGITYAHNSAGLYSRGRSIPTNPNSPAQQTARSALSTLSAQWQALTETQRTDWATYAANSPVIGRLGDPLILSGQQMFLRCNTPRSVASAPLAFDAPAVFGMTTLGPCVATTNAGSPADFSITFDETDPWASDDSSYLLIFSSLPMSPTINFFKGPFCFNQPTSGTTTLGPTPSPATGAYGQVQGPVQINPSVAAGQAIFYRLVASLVDGRLSPVQIVKSIAV